jgi:chemotaxis protein methyltransferase CheR
LLVSDKPAVDDRYAVCADRLFADLSKRCGFRRDELLMRKLVAVVSRFSTGEAAEWVDRVTALPGDDIEWLALVEGVTVHETYFFRDPAQLNLLRRELTGLVKKRAEAGRRRISVWSAGCASGEEAYSVAILVLDALAEQGEAAASWSIDILGTDISRHMVTSARDGVYGAPGLDSFRQMPAEHLVYFVNDLAISPRSKRVSPALKSLVRFQQHNLMDDHAPGIDFDVVLCRNVMIYFEDDPQAHTQDLLTEALATRGYLLLGVTDRIADPASYERCQLNNSVIYRKTG